MKTLKLLSIVAILTLIISCEKAPLDRVDFTETTNYQVVNSNQSSQGGLLDFPEHFEMNNRLFYMFISKDTRTGEESVRFTSNTIDITYPMYNDQIYVDSVFRIHFFDTMKTTYEVYQNDSVGGIVTHEPYFQNFFYTKE